MADQVALTLTTGQLWAALLVIGGAFIWVVVYIYNSEKDRTNQRLNGLNTKIKEETEKLRQDFNDKLAAQNLQLERALTNLSSTANELLEAVDDLDRRLLVHETKLGS